MKRNYFIPAFFSLAILFATSSCTKDPITQPTIIQPGSHHVPGDRPSEITMTISSWNSFGNNYYGTTLFDVVSQLNTTDHSTIKVFLVSDGKDFPLDKPITYASGLLMARVESTDVRITYQSFYPGGSPGQAITIKIAAI